MDVHGKNSMSLEKRREKFQKMQLSQMKRNADIFFLDELVEEEYFTNEMKDQVIDLLNDPSKIVISSMRNKEDLGKYGFLNFVKQHENQEVLDLNQKSTRDVQSSILKEIHEMGEKVENLTKKFEFDKNMDKVENIRNGWELNLQL